MQCSRRRFRLINSPYVRFEYISARVLTKESNFDCYQTHKKQTKIEHTRNHWNMHHIFETILCLHFFRSFRKKGFLSILRSKFAVKETKKNNWNTRMWHQSIDNQLMKIHGKLMRKENLLSILWNEKHHWKNDHYRVLPCKLIMIHKYFQRMIENNGRRFQFPSGHQPTYCTYTVVRKINTKNIEWIDEIWFNW